MEGESETSSDGPPWKRTCSWDVLYTICSSSLWSSLLFLTWYLASLLIRLLIWGARSRTKRRCSRTRVLFAVGDHEFLRVFLRKNFERVSILIRNNLRRFCFASLVDWSRIFTPSSQPIKIKTGVNHDLVTRIFPRFKLHAEQFVYLRFEIPLVPNYIFFSAVVIEYWNSLTSLLHWFFPTFFLSGLDRSAFDNKVVSFDEHINSEHNMWHYLYFIVLLKVKDTTEFTGPESYVSLMVKVHHEYGKRFMKWGKGRVGGGGFQWSLNESLGLNCSPKVGWQPFLSYL